MFRRLISDFRGSSGPASFSPGAIVSAVRKNSVRRSKSLRAKRGSFKGSVRMSTLVRGKEEVVVETDEEVVRKVLLKAQWMARHSSH